MSERQNLVDSFLAVRAATEALAGPLSPEDQQLQSMPECSPAKWHRAHTTWFFETFVLLPRGVAPFDPSFGYLFNSYYEAVGPRHARPKRGMLSRPTAAEVSGYRRAVDERIVEALASMPEPDLTAVRPVIELGLAHEEQHQELLLTDILNAFAENPTKPAYQSGRMQLTRQVATAAPNQPSEGSSRSDPGPERQRGPGGVEGSAEQSSFTEYPGGTTEIGVDLHGGLVFDNETPRHRVWLEPFAIADRLVTVGEWKAFADAGGYETPSLWLSDGFEFVRANGIRAPLYARREGGSLVAFGLGGERELPDGEPLSHVSFYEADAIATFLGARLPTEEEWEHAAGTFSPLEGNFRESGLLHPAPSGSPHSGSHQLFGDVWEWTRSGYSPYPGFSAAKGAIGEYNGKFMVNQFVLRGGSCLTPRGHVRATYRNFWHPGTRFQMSGMRLAKSLGKERRQ